MKQRIFKALEALFFLILAAGFLFLVPVEQIIHAIQDVSALPFWISCLLYLPISYLAALRLHLLVKRQGIKITRIRLFEIGLIVKFYSFFSPASSVGSFLRWYKLSGGGKTAEALMAVTINRLLDVFIATLFGLFWAVGSLGKSYMSQPAAFIIFIAVVFLLWLIGTRYAPHILDQFKARFETNPRPWLRRVADFAGRLGTSLAAYSLLSMLDLGRLIVLGLAGEFVGLLALIYLAQSLQIPISLQELGWMKSIFFLAALTPFTLAGGLGLREVSVVMILSASGVSTGLATAFSFLLYARSIIISLVGGILELLSFVKVPFHEKP